MQCPMTSFDCITCDEKCRLMERGHTHKPSHQDPERGSPWELGKCEQCDELSVGFTDDGEALCEDCMFEHYLEEEEAYDDD